MKRRKNKEFEDEVNRLKAMDEEMVELIAIWIGGTIRLSEGNLIVITDCGFITKNETVATHRCIGCFGNLSDTKHSIMVVDVITNEPDIIEL
jgi:hypothetical protein